MHERRNAILTIFFAIAMAWGFVGWLCVAVFPSFTHIWPSVDFHRYASLSAILLLAASLAYVHLIEDRMTDQLAQVAMGRYFEQDGLCFMPLVRVTRAKGSQQHAEISLYYQNRFEGECEAVIHIRPPKGSFFSHKGARDVHFAFRCQPGAFGVIHQPIAVGHEFLGRAVAVELAAMVRWVRHRGDQVRSRKGEPVGTFNVDWAAAYRQGKHELCGEIELHNPATLTLTLPDGVAEEVDRSEFVNETLMVKA